jgi:hypothetical protein
MPHRSPVTFTAGYDLDRKIEDFLAQRSSAVAAGSSSAARPLEIEFRGLEPEDRRIIPLRNAAGPLRLRLRFSPTAKAA